MFQEIQRITLISRIFSEYRAILYFWSIPFIKEKLAVYGGSFICYAKYFSLDDAGRTGMNNFISLIPTINSVSWQRRISSAL